MNGDAMTVDAIRAVKAREEREAVVAAMCTVMQQSQLLMAAVLAAKGCGTGRSVSVNIT
jgi:hypothetical protein